MEVKFHRLCEFPQGAPALSQCGSQARELPPSEVIHALSRAQTCCWVRGPENVLRKDFLSPSPTQDPFLGAKERVVSCVLIFQDKEVRLTADGDQCWEGCKEINSLSDSWNSHTPTQENLV